MVLGTIEITDSPIPWRKSERKKVIRASENAETKQFIVWDGEGTRNHNGRAQNYSLLGYCDGYKNDCIIAPSLSSEECLSFIIATGLAFPKAWHVSFAFDYDINMIVKDLTVKQLSILRDNGYVFYRGYRIEHIPHKWLRVTKDNVSVKIQDTWGFYQSSLLTALKTNIPDHPLMSRLAEIEAGKANRSVFEYEDIETIRAYWEIENLLFHALTEKLREMMYDPRVNLNITDWYGPGALASYTYKKHGIKEHKAETPSEVYTAARYAYAGGRFELFQSGRFENVYGIDINSAYPNAIAHLPSMSEGEWRHVNRPKKLQRFGMYHIRLVGPILSREPAPFFHRDLMGNISFPWITEGWYWGVEVTNAIHTGAVTSGVQFEVIEGWVYITPENVTRPFAFIDDMYKQRARLKAEKVGAQLALKLCLNSLYGKMAQRAGWERTGEAPTWHQLEWAGFVTAFTRAMLYQVMRKIPADQLIAVETDGIYTTATPESLGISHSTELGGWEVSRYDEMVYLQSGVYAIRNGDDWKCKYRGLDKGSLSAEDIVNHSKNLVAHEEWPPLVGTTTRFIGYRAALQRQQDDCGPAKAHHCVWSTGPKDISVGSVGKRRHIPKLCPTCEAGLTGYERAHAMHITPQFLNNGKRGEWSRMHAIPWLDQMERDEWRKKMEESEDELR